MSKSIESRIYTYCITGMDGRKLKILGLVCVEIDFYLQEIEMIN